MKKLVLGILVATVVSQAAGCVISTSDDTTNYATITANWSLETVAGGAATCPPGFDTAALYSQTVDSENRLTGSPIIDLFNCADGVGISDPLPPAVYASWIAITNGSNTSTYAESIKAIVDVVDVDKNYSASILTDGGYFEMTWDLMGATTNASLTCAQVPGVVSSTGGVEAVVTVSGGTASATDQFNCEDHYGLTAGFLNGSYTVSVDAFSASGAEGTAPLLVNKVINNANKVTDLGNIIIPIDGL